MHCFKWCGLSTTPPYLTTSRRLTPSRDAEALQAELIFCDLGILERRRQRIETNLKGARSQERSASLRETGFIDRLQRELENETPVSAVQLTHEEQDLVTSYNMLSGKPVLTVFNIGEDALATGFSSNGTDSDGTAHFRADVCVKLGAGIGPAFAGRGERIP